MYKKKPDKNQSLRCGNCGYFPGQSEICPHSTYSDGAYAPVQVGSYACKRFRDKREHVYRF